MAGGTDNASGSAPSGALLLLLATAGLAGAAGVALAAVAAHRIESPALATAAVMLMVHAAAALAMAAIGLRSAAPGRWTAAGAFMLAAVALFAGDVAIHVFTDAHIFPYAAPTGGFMTILSWVLIAVLAGRDFFRSGGRDR